MKKLERVLCVDVETTGLDREKDKVIEVAGVLVDVSSAEIIAATSCLGHAEENPAESVNQIPASLLRRLSFLSSPFEPFVQLAALADAFVAHRASFDRAFFHESIARLAPWVCSKFGIEWRCGRYGDHLVDLALAHGIPVTGHHRALDDALLLARVMKRSKEMEDGEGIAVSRRTDLAGLLAGGVKRGIGEPNKCRHPYEHFPSGNWAYDECNLSQYRDPCGKWVRSYRSDVYYCPAHGGPKEWVS